MSRPPIVQVAQSYSFSDYFKLKFSQDILACIGVLLVWLIVLNPKRLES
jgi:hypothetical protein